MSQVPQSRGSYLVALKSFVRSNYGDVGWQTVLASLPEQDRGIVDNALAVSWIGVDVRLRANRAFWSTVGNCNNEALTALGRYEAERDFNVALRVFLRVLSPASVVSSASKMYRHFWTTGELTGVDLGAGKARCIITNGPQDELHCCEFISYVVRVFEFTGAKGVRSLHPECRGRGDDRCVFDGLWN